MKVWTKIAEKLAHHSCGAVPVACVDLDCRPADACANVRCWINVDYQCGLGGSPRGWQGQGSTFLHFRLHILPIPCRAHGWRAEHGLNCFSSPSLRLFHPDPRILPETCIPNLNEQNQRDKNACLLWSFLEKPGEPKTFWPGRGGSFFSNQHRDFFFVLLVCFNCKYAKLPVEAN